MLAWHTPERSGEGPVVQAIQKVQNKGLRAVAGAYRTTLIRELKKKVFVSLIDIYYNKLSRTGKAYAKPCENH
jgi:hypothetical protein